MANWLDKALGRKTETTAVPVVPFEVRCECGSRLTGMRGERARRAICAQCGEAHFILPTNQYPESDRTYFGDRVEEAEGIPSTERPGPEADRSVQSDIYAIAEPDADTAIDDDPKLAIDFDGDASAGADDDYEYLPDEDEAADDPLADLDQPVDEPKRTKQPRRESLYEPPEAVSQTVRSDEVHSRRAARASRRKSRRDFPPSGVIEVTPAASQWGETSRRVGIVMGILAGVAVAMAWWVIRNQAVEHAEARLAEAADKGTAALQSGEFVEARQQLQMALDALDVMGADDQQIAPLRRMWLEADAATRLLDGSLVEIVEATQESLGLSAEEWQRQFDVRFGDRWLLLDISPVETVQVVTRQDEDDEGVAETRVVFPWSVNDRPVQIAGIVPLVTGRQSRVVLAGRLNGSEFDQDAQAWVVRLSPSDSFLWTSFPTLVRLGFAFEADADLKRVLDEQAGPARASSAVAQSENGATVTEAVPEVPEPEESEL